MVAAEEHAGRPRLTSSLSKAHGGPNPWKVIMVLEELGVPYESVSDGENLSS